MKALGRYIIVDEVKESHKSQGGLLLTSEDTIGMRYRKGKIISSGKLIEYLKKDDEIYYNTLTTHEIRLKGNLYTVVEEKDVVVVL
ncbi:MAG: hypothetical protein GY810_00250 [Aureispira sp.]|jgi:co-chaperonin GroES (HSP10)|nr:hypothetical protein [Aureispira sp.]